MESKSFQKILDAGIGNGQNGLRLTELYGVNRATSRGHSRDGSLDALRGRRADVERSRERRVGVARASRKRCVKNRVEIL
jgi:hypothetical protein